MSHTYFTRHIIQTPSSFGSREDIDNLQSRGWEFNYNKNKILIYDTSNGLTVDSYIVANSMNKAEQQSKTLIETTVNLIDFSTSAASLPARLIAVYNASNGVRARQFKQVTYNTLQDRNVRKIDKDVFGAIFDVFKKTDDTRIARSISWLRKGNMESKPIDAFTSFWIGLESLNELLNDFYDIPKEKRYFVCDECNKTHFPITSGVETLFITELEVSKKQFKKIRGLRGKLLHGGGPLNSKFVHEIHSYNSLTREALIVALGKLLSLNSTTVNNIVNKKPCKYKENITIVVRAKLINFKPPQLQDFGKQPHLELVNHEVTNRIYKNDGGLTVGQNTKFNVKNAKFDIKSVELWSDDNSSLNNAQINNIK